MTVTDVLKLARQQGVTLYLKQQQLAYKATNKGLSDELRTALKAYKQDIIRLLQDSEQVNPSVTAILSAQQREQGTDLSFSQRRLWLLENIEPDTCRFNMPMSFLIEGPLNRDWLLSSLRTIVERHHILRTFYRNNEAGHGLQFITDNYQFDLPEVSLIDLPTDGQGSVLNYLELEEARKPFDLTCELSIRAKLIRMHECKFCLLLTLHHIAADDWSLGRFTHELNEHYTALSRGQPLLMQSLKIQYQDYACWQAEVFNQQRLTPLLSYWQERLAGAPLTHSLPMDFPRPAQPSYIGDNYKVELPSELVKRLQGTAKRLNLTLFCLLSGLLSAFVYRLTDQEKVVIGSPVANRDQWELNELVGFFVNTIALRSDFSAQSTLNRYLLNHKENVITDFAHQQLPFETLVDHLKPRRSANTSPIFQIAIAMQNNELGEFDLPNLKIRPRHKINISAKYDLTLNISDAEDQLLFDWEYATDLFSLQGITQLHTRFVRFVKAALNAPDEPLCHIPLMTEKECRRLLNNSTEIDEIARVTPVHQLACVAENQSQKILLRFQSESLSYADVERLSETLAGKLQTLASRPNARIAVGTQNPLLSSIVLLATWKCGCIAHLFTEPETLERSADSIDLLICDKAGYAACSGYFNGEILQESLLTLHQHAHNDSINKPWWLRRRSVAFEICSSQINRQFYCTHQDLAIFTKQPDWHAQLDFSVVSCDPDVSIGFLPFLLSSVIHKQGSLHYGQQLQKKASLRVAGQADAAGNRESLLPHAAILSAINQKTEDAKNDAAFEWRWCLPVGQQTKSYLYRDNGSYLGLYPIAFHARVRSEYQVAGQLILDRHGELAVPGVVGRLVNSHCLAGSNSGAPQCRPNPYIPGEQIRETGQRARWTVRNNELVIESMGDFCNTLLIDDQLLDFADVLVAIKKLPQVASVKLVATQGLLSKSDVILSVTLVPEATVSGDHKSHQADEIYQHINRLLPTSNLVVGIELKQQQTGSDEVSTQPVQLFTEHSFTAPETGTEKGLAEIWSKLLDIDGNRIGKSANFFELGGHSLLLVRLASEIRERFGTEISLSQIMNNQHLDVISLLIDERLLAKQIVLNGNSNIDPDEMEITL